MPPRTRTNSICTCEICRIGKTSLPNINPCQKFSIKSKRGRPLSKLPPQMLCSAKKMCTFCFSEIRKGIPHICTRKRRYENLQVALSPKSKDNLTSANLKKKIIEQKSTSVQVATRGMPMKVSVGYKVQQKLNFSLPHSSMLKMQTGLNLSDRQVLQVGQIIREGSGSRRAIIPNLSESLAVQGKLLQHFFHCQTFNFIYRSEQGKTQKTVSRPNILCKNLTSLIKFICKKRGIQDHNSIIKIGIDGGGGSIKLCLNIIENSGSNSSSILSVKPPTRNTRSSVGKKFLDSGVKKLIIVSIVFDVQELYENISVLLKALNVDGIHYCIATDLKLANILIGIQSHSCKHPCIFCEGCAPWSTSSKLRTIGKVKELVQDFKNSGEQLKKSGDFMNCIHDPLIIAEDSALILDIIPPPELHLMLGAVNKMFDELNAAWGDDGAYKLAADHNIIRCGYRGGSLEGNQCKLLLNQIDFLQNALLIHLLKFAVALRAFNSVRKSCFGENLLPSFKNDIKLFKVAYEALQISVTPKVHIIFEHVPQFCEEKNCGLGKFSEQASESVHADFKKTWIHYAIPQSHEHFDEHLLQAVIKYNSLHL